MNETGVTRETEFFFRRLTEPLTLQGSEVDPRYWLAFLIPILLLGFAYVIWMYLRDSRSVGLGWASGLALLRLGVYVLIALIFLLPARQEWETSQKKSRVLLLVDVSPSVQAIRDEQPRSAAELEAVDTRPTRFDKIANLLSNEQVGLIQKLTEKNPVWVYRFGGRADDQATAFQAGETVYDSTGWHDWAKFDFKDWVLGGLTPAGQERLKQMSTFEADQTGTPDWAIGWLARPEAEVVPSGLTPVDKKRLLANRDQLNDRLEVARQIGQGTDVPGSILSVINREANNLLQGIIVLSDGRSTRGSEATLRELRQRATQEDIPIFTIAVGEDLPKVEIRITDVQAPTRTPPDEPFKVYVDVDGEGLPGAEVSVSLDLIPPGQDQPAHTLTNGLTFTPGEPPHGQAEFILDPAELPEELRATEPSGKTPELLEGEWKLAARIPRDRREFFPAAEHVSDPPAKVQVLKAPLRVLMITSAPNRDFQFLRTLLVREKERAELSLWIQNEGGRAGKIAADVDPNRLLTSFPTRLDVNDPGSVPEEKYYNLAEYDLIVAFDPDWSLCTPGQLQMLETWINNGGGLVYVAGPIHTAQLARKDDAGVQALLNVLPLIPGDNVLASIRRSTSKPWRLTFPGVNQETDFLKLDDELDGALAGWERFFTGQDEPAPQPKPNPRRGFYGYYPVQAVKEGVADVIARFSDPDARGKDDKDSPYLVTMRYGQGRSVFLGSAETYRLRGYSRDYFNRFWLKLLRYTGVGSIRKESRQGRLLMSREFRQGDYIRIQAELKGADLQPLSATAVPKLTIRRLGPDAERFPAKPFEMAPRKSPRDWDGMFQRQILASTRAFPAGEYRLDLAVPDSSDTLTTTFRVRESNPELDNTRPDYAALVAMASDVDAVTKRIEDPQLVGAFQRALRSNSDRLAFRLEQDPSAIALIPTCMSTDVRINRNRGPVEDLWDNGVILPKSLTRGFTDQTVEVSYLLLGIVGLISVEWLTRKLLRLA